MKEILTNKETNLKEWLNNILIKKNESFNYTYININDFKLEINNINDYSIKYYYDIGNNEYILKYQFTTSDINFFDWFIESNLIYLEG